MILYLIPALAAGVMVKSKSETSDLIPDARGSLINTAETDSVIEVLGRLEEEREGSDKKFSEESSKFLRNFRFPKSTGNYIE